MFPYTMNGTGVSENFSKFQNQFFLFYSVKGCQEHVSGHYESIGTFFLVHFYFCGLFGCVLVVPMTTKTRKPPRHVKAESMWRLF